MTSELFYKDKMISVRESLVEVVVCYLLKLTEDDPRDPWLDRARETWMETRRGRGLGMTSLEIHRLVKSDADESRLLSLLQRLDVHLTAHGNTLSSAEINSLKPPYTHFIEDLPVQKYEI